MITDLLYFGERAEKKVGNQCCKACVTSTVVYSRELADQTGEVILCYIRCILHGPRVLTCCRWSPGLIYDSAGSFVLVETTGAVRASPSGGTAMDYYARDECLRALRRSDSEVQKAQGHAPLRPRSDLWTVLLDMERRGEPAAHKDLLVSSRELSACDRKGPFGLH